MQMQHYHVIAKDRTAAIRTYLDDNRRSAQRDTLGELSITEIPGFVAISKESLEQLIREHKDQEQSQR